MLHFFIVNSIHCIYNSEGFPNRIISIVNNIDLQGFSNCANCTVQLCKMLKIIVQIAQYGNCANCTVQTIK
jgi:hypothetical protein